MSAHRSLDDLLALRARLRKRRHHTPLEQVRTEVGDIVYAEIERSSWDRPVVLRRGTIVGLPQGTYLILLGEAIHRRREQVTVATMAAV